MLVTVAVRVVLAVEARGEHRDIKDGFEKPPLDYAEVVAEYECGQRNFTGSEACPSSRVNPLNITTLVEGFTAGMAAYSRAP